MRATCLLLVAIAALACLAPTATAQGCGTYTIKPGDTFWDLAQAQGFPVDEIVAANPGVVPERLQVGQLVNLPCQGGGAVNGTPAQAPAPTGTGRKLLACETVTIQPGDTFDKIATLRGIPLDDVLKANPGVDPMTLMVGQMVNLPC